jgi:hypothetical protein
LFIYIQDITFSNEIILFIGIIATFTIGVTTASFGLSLASAQMADNATLGNMTMGAGNMTSDANSTDTTGSISMFESLLQREEKP